MPMHLPYTLGQLYFDVRQHVEDQWGLCNYLRPSQLFAPPCGALIQVMEDMENWLKGDPCHLPPGMYTLQGFDWMDTGDCLCAIMTDEVGQDHYLAMGYFAIDYPDSRPKVLFVVDWRACINPKKNHPLIVIRRK